MIREAILREPDTIQEEIYDLSNYLEGLPEGVRSCGAFSSYELRLEELKKELNQSRLYRYYLKVRGSNIQFSEGEPLITKTFLCGQKWLNSPGKGFKGGIVVQVRPSSKKRHPSKKGYAGPRLSKRSGRHGTITVQIAGQSCGLVRRQSELDKKVRAE